LSIRGEPGADGIDGVDGRDAPYVVDIRVDQYKSDEADFIFEFSDGTEIRTNSVKLPRPRIYYGGGGCAGGSISMKMTTTQIVTAQDTTGPIAGIISKSSKKSFQVVGRTTEGVGAAVVKVYACNNNVNWGEFQEHTLTLGETDFSSEQTADNTFKYIRTDVISISGTGATVDVYMAEEEWT
jgi:hypothetical protein